MKNWRKRSTSPDRPEYSSNSMPNKSSNFQNREDLTSRYLGQQGETREAFRKVEDLIELNHKNSSEIIIELTEKLDDFSELLTSHLEPNWIVLIIAILSKVCSSCFRQTKLDVLKVAINGNFLQTLEKCARNIIEGEYRENIFFNNPEEFLVNVRYVHESIINIIPTNYCDTLHNMVKFTEFFPSPGKGINLEEWQKNNSNFKILMERLKLYKEHQEISVYPSFEEIFTSNCGLGSKDFVEGKYNNVKDYLDAQLKLLKDSFAAALRQDIVKSIEHAQGPNGHMQCCTIRMYQDVVFRSMVFNCTESGVIVNFSNKEDLEPIFSPHARCFEWGSVVCFTNDNFYTIFFGSVIKKDCSQNNLIIGFKPEDNNYETNVPYTMVECNVNLYPYHYILKGLPCMSEEDFPLKTYLIDAVPKAEAPGYLDSTSSIHLGQGSRVDVFDNNWPSSDELKLDSSQYSAFKAALTQKFVMIQGAPGTGKTYLGLQIVKTLLHEDNQKLWYNGTPILIVCLSKQALDQFLEGLISTTNRIITVCQQSKNDKLVNFTLGSARTKSYARRNVLIVLYKKMKVLIKELKECQDCLNTIKNFNYIILNFSNFGSIDEKIKTSWFSCASSADMLTWIFDEQSQNLQSLQISEIIENIMEEEKHFDSGDEDNGALGEL